MSITLVGWIKQMFLLLLFLAWKNFFFENYFCEIIGKHGIINVKTKSIKTLTSDMKIINNQCVVSARF